MLFPVKLIFLDVNLVWKRAATCYFAVCHRWNFLKWISGVFLSGGWSERACGSSQWDKRSIWVYSHSQVISSLWHLFYCVVLSGILDIKPVLSRYFKSYVTPALFQEKVWTIKQVKLIGALSSSRERLLGFGKFECIDGGVSNVH